MNSTDIAEAASACIATRVRRLSRLITRVYDEALRPLGITASQYILLAHIATHKGTSCVDITYSLDIDKSTLSRNLTRLRGMQLVEVERHAGRYPRGVSLTRAGEHALNRAFPLWQTTQQRALDFMGAESCPVLDLMVSKAGAMAPVVVATKRKLRA